MFAFRENRGNGSVVNNNFNKSLKINNILIHHLKIFLVCSKFIYLPSTVSKEQNLDKQSKWNEVIKT